MMKITKHVRQHLVYTYCISAKKFKRQFPEIQFVSKLIFGICSILLLFCLCQKKVQKEIFIVTATGDTLSIQMARNLAPGEISDSLRFCNVLVRKGLATAVKASAPDSVDVLLAKQLSLESGVEWSLDAAALLFDAASAFRTKLEQVQNCSFAVSFADSLFNVVAPEKKYGFPLVNCLEKGENELRWMSMLFAELFSLSSQTSTALAVFTNDQTSSNQTGSDAEAMVKGLVLNGDQPQEAAIVTKKVVHPKAKQADGDPAELLRLRDKNSIVASISKHIPEIKSLYKKHLKQNSALGGTIIITFRVAPGGDVLDVSVAKSDIDDNRFIQPLLVYIKTIQFKPVTNDAGIMTFEFPFEFDKET